MFASSRLTLPSARPSYPCAFGREELISDTSVVAVCNSLSSPEFYTKPACCRRQTLVSSAVMIASRYLAPYAVGAAQLGLRGFTEVETAYQPREASTRACSLPNFEVRLKPAGMCQSGHENDDIHLRIEEVAKNFRLFNGSTLLPEKHCWPRRTKVGTCKSTGRKMTDDLQRETTIFAARDPPRRTHALSTWLLVRSPCRSASPGSHPLPEEPPCTALVWPGSLRRRRWPAQSQDQYATS